MSHPYGRKIKIIIVEYSQTANTPTQLMIEGSSLVKTCKRAIECLLEKHYCMPGDVLSVGFNYTRGNADNQDIKSITINFEDEKNVQVSSG